MNDQVFRLHKEAEFRKAGAGDLIEVTALPGDDALYLPKWILEVITYSFVSGSMLHLSGETGVGKTRLLELLTSVPENFLALCRWLGFDPRPLKLFPIEMAIFETPGELYQRRALKDGCTFDEPSVLVRSLKQAAKLKQAHYVAMWLREMGRVHSSSVQGGLLNLMTSGTIALPDGSAVSGMGIGWVADSNYQAEGDSNFTLVTLDDALKRRLVLNVAMRPLSAEQELVVLRHLLAKSGKRTDDDALTRIVHMGQVVRRYRTEGNLLSVAPPTIAGYKAMAEMALGLPHLPLQQVALATLLGNATTEDQKHLPGVFHEVLGIRKADMDDVALESNLF